MNLRERRAQVRAYLGKTVTIQIDRPIGTAHEKNGNRWVYPINYGFIPGVLGGDGEELDVYLLGVDHPVREAVCRVIGAVLREDDDEDKLIAAPPGMTFTAAEMAAAVHFQERFHVSRVVTELPLNH